MLSSLARVVATIADESARLRSSHMELRARRVTVARGDDPAAANQMLPLAVLYDECSFFVDYSNTS